VSIIPAQYARPEERGPTLVRLPLMTSSRLKDARACQRLHQLRYELGYRPAEEAAALRFGTLCHDGLKAWWEAPTERLAAALNAIRTAVFEAEGEPDLFALARAESMLIGYDTRWKDEPYEVLAVEQPFETELRNPVTGRASQTWRLAGKIDAVVRDLRDGRILVVEHKTAAGDISPGSEYWRRLRMDGQVSVYFEGARSLGYDVAGCLYDVLGKPAQKPLMATPPEERRLKKDGTPYANVRLADETPAEFHARVLDALAEGPNRFFVRGEVTRLNDEMAEHLYDIWQTAQGIRENELSGRHPRNPDACVRYGRTCPFFDACTGVASLDDPQRFRRIESVHPELSVQ
jgi:hypothetical protein